MPRRECELCSYISCLSFLIVGSGQRELRKIQRAACELSAHFDYRSRNLRPHFTRTMASSLIGKAVSTAGQLAARGLLERVLTFTLNQLLVRFVDPEVFGLASIRFELILSTVLFLSREGLRLAMIRLPQLDLMPKPGEGRAAKDGRQRFINTCWLSAPVGVLFSLGAGLALWWTTAAGADGGLELIELTLPAGDDFGRVDVLVELESNASNLFVLCILLRSGVRTIQRKDVATDAVWAIYTRESSSVLISALTAVVTLLTSSTYSGSDTRLVLLRALSNLIAASASFTWTEADTLAILKPLVSVAPHLDTLRVDACLALFIYMIKLPTVGETAETDITALAVEFLETFSQHSVGNLSHIVQVPSLPFLLTSVRSIDLLFLAIQSASVMEKQAPHAWASGPK